MAHKEHKRHIPHRELTIYDNNTAIATNSNTPVGAIFGYGNSLHSIEQTATWNNEVAK